MSSDFLLALESFLKEPAAAAIVGVVGTLFGALIGYFGSVASTNRHLRFQRHQIAINHLMKAIEILNLAERNFIYDAVKDEPGKSTKEQLNLLFETLTIVRVYGEKEQVVSLLNCFHGDESWLSQWNIARKDMDGDKSNFTFNGYVHEVRWLVNSLHELVELKRKKQG